MLHTCRSLQPLSMGVKIIYPFSTFALLHDLQKPYRLTERSSPLFLHQRQLAINALPSGGLPRFFSYSIPISPQRQADRPAPILKAVGNFIRKAAPQNPHRLFLDAGYIAAGDAQQRRHLPLGHGRPAPQPVSQADHLLLPRA